MRTVLLFSLLLAGPGSRAADQSGPRIRVSSHLVQVNVVVHDRAGKPVQSLTRDDFTIFDQNKVRETAVFSPLVISDGNSERAPASDLVFTNRPQQLSQGSGALTIVLFDTLNLTRDVADFTYAKQQLIRFLKTVKPGDPVALYQLAGPQVQVIHEFTSDSASLLRAVQQLTTLHPMTESVLEPGRSGNTGGRSFAGVELTPEYTLRALEAIAHHVEGLSGRKNLVWMSAGFRIAIGFDPEALAIASVNAQAKDGKVIADSGGLSPTMDELDPQLRFYTGRIEQAMKLVNHADLAIYPIDLQGLMADPTPGNGERGGPGRMKTVGETSLPQSTSMEMIAEKTGGRAFRSANDLGGSIGRAMDDARVTYTLGFYVPENEWDGRYHKLTIKLREPGLEARYRRGYYAQDASSFGEDRNHALHVAADSPLDDMGIGVRVNVTENPVPWGFQDMVVVVDPHDLSFREDDGRFRADIDMVFVQQTGDGRILSGQKDEMRYALYSDHYDQALGQGLFVRRHLEVTPGASRLRVLVRDASSGAVGSVSVPVKGAHAKGRQ